jgi:hypothetical protein
MSESFFVIDTVHGTTIMAERENGQRRIVVCSHTLSKGDAELMCAGMNRSAAPRLVSDQPALVMRLPLMSVPNRISTISGHMSLLQQDVRLNAEEAHTMRVAHTHFTIQSNEIALRHADQRMSSNG